MSQSIHFRSRMFSAANVFPLDMRPHAQRTGRRLCILTQRQSRAPLRHRSRTALISLRVLGPQAPALFPAVQRQPPRPLQYPHHLLPRPQLAPASRPRRRRAFLARVSQAATQARELVGIAVTQPKTTSTMSCRRPARLLSTTSRSPI